MPWHLFPFGTTQLPLSQSFLLPGDTGDNTASKSSPLWQEAGIHPVSQRRRWPPSRGSEGTWVVVGMAGQRGRVGSDTGVSQLGPLNQNATQSVASTQRFIFSLSYRLELQDQDVSRVGSFWGVWGKGLLQASLSLLTAILSLGLHTVFLCTRLCPNLFF